MLHIFKVLKTGAIRSIFQAILIATNLIELKC